MLIYNKKLSVAPITTHIPISDVNKNINKNSIVKKVKVINNFYKNVFGKKPNIAILGLNPHNYSPSKKPEEKKIISKAIKNLIKLKISVTGPISPDTSFMIFKNPCLTFISLLDLAKYKSIWGEIWLKK